LFLFTTYGISYCKVSAWEKVDFQTQVYRAQSFQMLTHAYSLTRTHTHTHEERERESNGSQARLLDE